MALVVPIKLVWVPGHCGVSGNTIADGLARLGASIKFVGPAPCLSFTKSWFTTRLGYWSVNKHNAYWSNLNTCLNTKLYFDKAILNCRKF